MLSVLNMFLACLLIFPLFTGTTQAERSPLCEGAIVVEDSYVGETISVTLAGVEPDSQEKTYTLYWLVDCMLDDPAAVSPDYSIPMEEQPPHLFLWYCAAYAGEKELLCIERRNPVIMTDMAEFSEKEGTAGFLCYAVLQERDLPRKADEIDVHFTVMRQSDESRLLRLQRRMGCRSGMGNSGRKLPPALPPQRRGGSRNIISRPDAWFVGVFPMFFRWKAVDVEALHPL